MRVDRELVEWDYSQYEGRRTAEIRKERPDWELFRDGCPGGESPAEVAARADRVVSRVRAVPGDVLLFSSGHFIRVLATRWIGLEVTANAKRFMLSTASLSAVGYENELSRPVTGCGMIHIMLATNSDGYPGEMVMPETKTKILVCNAGSSSLKFSLFDSEDEVLLADGGVDWLRKPARLVFRGANQPEIREELKLEKHADAVARILDDLQAGASAALQRPGDHRLTYRRPGQHHIHVRGSKEQGNINMPLELAICNQTDRFSLAIDAIDRMPRFRVTGASVREALLNQKIACKQHAYEFGIDPPEITDWKWRF